MPQPDQADPSRGEIANPPPRSTGRDTLEIAIRVFKRIGHDQLSLIAAGVAFFGMLALFPALAALVALGGAFVDPAQIVVEAEAYLSALPVAAQEIVQGQLVELATADRGTLNVAAIIALAIAIYSSSKGMANLMSGLNVAYAEKEERGFLVLRLRIILLTVFALISGLLSLGALTVLPIAADLLFPPSVVTDLILVLRWPLLVLFASLAFTIIYRFGPSRAHARWRWIAPGGVLAVLIWIAATLGFAWYVQVFGRYNETFGTLAGVIILLMWLWLSAYSILLGATLDAEMEAQYRKTSQTGDDPTSPRI